MAFSGTPLPPPRTHRGLAPARCGICSAGCPAFGRRGACETTATGAQGSSPTGEPLAYGFGWRAGLLDGDGPRVVEHTGATPGTFAHVVMLPEQHRTVIVLGRGYSEALAPARQVSATTWPGRSPAATPDPLLWWSPWALSALAVLLVLGAAPRARLTRLGGRERRHNRAWAWGLSLASVLLASAAWCAPRALGHDRRQRMIWLPDLWWATTALCCAGVLAALVVTVSGIRRRGAGTPSPGGRSPAPR